MKFYLTNSKGLLCAFCCLYLLMALAVIFADLHNIYRLIILLPLVAHGSRMCQLHALRLMPQAVVRVWCEYEKWYAETIAGSRIQGKLGNYTYFSSLLIIMCITNKYTKKFILIPADALPAPQFRRLAAKINN